MRFSLYFAVFVTFIPSTGITQYNPQEWPRFTLSFSRQGTLKDVFDAGLRPYRFPSLEQSVLEAKHARITVVQQDGESLPEFDSALLEIDPLSNGLLYSIEMNTYKMSLDKARTLMLRWLYKGNRTAQQLENFLNAVKANYLDYDDPFRGMSDKFVTQWKDSSEVRYAIWFSNAFDPAQPLIFNLKIDWSRIRTPKESRSFYMQPIPPPPGYENVSMDAPKNFGPDSRVDILQAQGKPISGSRTPHPLGTPILTPLPASPPIVSATNPKPSVQLITSTQSSISYPWLVVLSIFILCVIIGVFLLLRKR
jgi:hypothetical protein